ncbi:hypothetical protein PMALA_053580, partial [Plasmodium malariae]
LNSSISKWKIEEYSHKKPGNTKEIIAINCYASGNKENNGIHGNIGENIFTQEIEDWIRKDNTYVNSIVNDKALDKSDEIAEKYVL